MNTQVKYAAVDPDSYHYPRYQRIEFGFNTSKAAEAHGHAEGWLRVVVKEYDCIESDEDAPLTGSCFQIMMAERKGELS